MYNCSVIPVDCRKNKSFLFFHGVNYKFSIQKNLLLWRAFSARLIRVPQEVLVLIER